CPTGSGKTRVASELAARATAKGKRTGIFTHRRILLGQAASTLTAGDVEHGVMAADYDPQLLADVQVVSIPTVASRVFNQGRWELPFRARVWLDEAHLTRAETAQRILEHYKAQGAVVIGMTATPVGLGALYETLVVAGTPSELRRYGALVPCDVFAPD